MKDSIVIILIFISIAMLILNQLIYGNDSIAMNVVPILAKGAEILI